MTAAERDLLLKAFPLLRDEKIWLPVINRLLVRSVTSSMSILTQNENGDGLYFIISGKFAVQVDSGFAEKKRAIALLEGGAIAGEGMLAGAVARQITVAAVEASTVAILSQASFAEIEQQHPETAVALLKYALRISQLRLAKSSERLGLVL